MTKIRSLFARVRIEFVAIGLMLLFAIVFVLRLYVCRFDGTVVLAATFLGYPAILGALFRLVVLDLLFATIGLMTLDGGFSKAARLTFRIGFFAAVLAFILDTVLVLAQSTSDPTVNAPFFFGRAEFTGGTAVLVGGFGVGFYLFLVVLLAYGVAVFLHPGYAGNGAPTLWGDVFHKLGRRDPLTLIRAGHDPDLHVDVIRALFYTLVSFGVYDVFWMYRTIKSLHRILGLEEPLMKTFLLSLFLAPVIQVWYGLRMRAWDGMLLARRAELGIPRKEDNGMAYLLFCVFGMGVVATALLQLDLNRIDAAEAVLRPRTTV